LATLLLSHRLHASRGVDIAKRARDLGHELELIVLPADPAARLPDEVCARVELAFFSSDVFPEYSRQSSRPCAKRPGSRGCTCSTPASTIRFMRK
jgi:hypothetical protein